MKPHLVRWHNDYAEKGLVVIDIDDGAQDAIDALKKEVEHGKFPFAVLWDKEKKNITALGVEGYPHAFLVGPDGKVVWEGPPDPKPSGAEKLEALIKEELGKAKK